MLQQVWHIGCMSWALALQCRMGWPLGVERSQHERLLDDIQNAKNAALDKMVNDGEISLRTGEYTIIQILASSRSYCLYIRRVRLLTKMARTLYKVLWHKMFILRLDNQVTCLPLLCGSLQSAPIFRSILLHASTRIAWSSDHILCSIQTKSLHS